MRAQQQRAMPDPDAAALAAQLHTSNNEPNDNGNAGDSTDMVSTRLLVESFRGDGEAHSSRWHAAGRQRPCSRAAWSWPSERRAQQGGRTEGRLQTGKRQGTLARRP
ncbi:hypothetical protein BC831DRAFT_454152 [Entophlyctis helioformis]|nr:hypothetical protein BC831DRAFT_454152 [Entophlyctis helioformis]